MSKSIDRRKFLRLSATSIGAGALLQFMPAGSHGAIAERLAQRNGEAPAPFRIVQLSDTHVGFQGPPDPLGTRAFERAVEVVNALDPQPDLVLFTGDLTHDSEDPAEHAKRMKTFREIAGRLRAQRRFYVPGEHDAALDGGVLFRENFGESHYSFDHRGVHFIALDNVSNGRPIVGEAQIAWLKRDLARYSKSTPIVVFTHRPLFDLKPEWEWFTTDGDAVMNALAPYESVAVLYGHIHRPHHYTSGHAQHFGARSLIFGFPDPVTTAGAKKPLPFDPAQPFHNLGIRRVSAMPIGVDDVELSLAEVAGVAGVQQILKADDAPAPPRVVDIRAKRFAFTPDEVHLKAGEAVTVRLTAGDVSHGLLVKPLGIDLDAVPDHPDAVTITPQAPGRYEAICDHYCGSGHGGMKMTFIVE